MFFFVQGDEVPEPRPFCQPEWEQIGWRWVGRRLMESPLPSPLFPSLSDSLWRGLWRQTGHLLGSGDWGRQSKVNMCPSPGVQHRPAGTSTQGFQTPESAHFPAVKPQKACALRHALSRDVALPLLGHAFWGWSLLAMSQWEGEPRP